MFRISFDLRSQSIRTEQKHLIVSLSSSSATLQIYNCKQLFAFTSSRCLCFCACDVCLCVLSRAIESNNLSVFEWAQKEDGDLWRQSDMVTQKGRIVFHPIIQQWAVPVSQSRNYTGKHGMRFTYVCTEYMMKHISTLQCLSAHSIQLISLSCERVVCVCVFVCCDCFVFERQVVVSVHNIRIYHSWFWFAAKFNSTTFM